MIKKHSCIVSYDILSSCWSIIPGTTWPKSHVNSWCYLMDTVHMKEETTSVSQPPFNHSWPSDIKRFVTFRSWDSSSTCVWLRPPPHSIVTLDGSHGLLFAVFLVINLCNTLWRLIPYDGFNTTPCTQPALWDERKKGWHNVAHTHIYTYTHTHTLTHTQTTTNTFLVDISWWNPGKGGEGVWF